MHVEVAAVARTSCTAQRFDGSAVRHVVRAGGERIVEAEEEDALRRRSGPAVPAHLH